MFYGFAMDHVSKREGRSVKGREGKRKEFAHWGGQPEPVLLQDDSLHRVAGNLDWLLECRQ